MYKNLFITNDGREVYLTNDELKVIRALRRLEKMNFGRLRLFGNGTLTVRMVGSDGDNTFDGWNKDVIEDYSIYCEGGDGGDGGDNDK